VSVREEVAGMRSSTYPRVRLHHQVGRSAEPRSRACLSAFTLIEILIVVVILAIAAMTAVPMLSSASSMQIRSAVNLIMADLEYAKSMAISRGQNYSVVFDVSSDSYSIQDQGGNVIPHPVKKGQSYTISFPNEGRLSRVDIANVDFSGGQTVQFDCLGSPDHGGTITLQAGDMTATVTVEPVTGFISS
jgi:prepilin-type N-terminal cleavage/methylation domain-containing protein